jgi:uncharacterized membrane protein
MPRLSTSVLWFGVFTALFLLSQDYWSWDEELILGLANYPTWLFYFIALQVILAILLAMFTLIHWGKTSTKGKNQDHE